MEDYPNPVTKQCTQKILDQMNKNFIYKINVTEEKFLIGFFCKIKNKNKKIPVMIINNYILYEENKDIINVSINNEMKKIKFGNTRYLNKEFNISMIDIKEDKDIDINYLEIDSNISGKDSDLKYYKESIYIIQPYNENEASVSYGKINNITKSQLIYNGNLNSNSHGLPIFNLSNNKIIGIHNNKSKYYNKGIFLRYMINEFNKIFHNEIEIIIDIKEKDINKKIFFLDNYKEDKDNDIYKNKLE